MWKIYYSDDEVITSEQATPFSLQRRADVQVIVQESKEHNWITRSGKDYYIWVGMWEGVDIFGLHHYLLQPGPKCVLFGTVIDTHRFSEIFNRARKEMGNKEAFEPGERHPDE